MATQNQFLTTTIKADEDLNSHQYFAVALDDGKIANDGLEASGILINKPKDNHFATLGYCGEMKFRAGVGLSAGDRLRVTTSGYFVSAASGYYFMGRVKAAVTSGSIGTGLFNFTAPVYQVSSL